MGFEGPEVSKPGIPSEVSAAPTELFERVREIERLDRVSVIWVETNYWGGATGSFEYGLSGLSELSRERGFSHFVVLDECARRLGSAPGSDLWDVFTTIQWNWGGRAAEGPDDQSGRPQMCGDE